MHLSSTVPAFHLFGPAGLNVREAPGSRHHPRRRHTPSIYDVPNASNGAMAGGHLRPPQAAEHPPPPHTHTHQARLLSPGLDHKPASDGAVAVRLAPAACGGRC